MYYVESSMHLAQEETYPEVPFSVQVISAKMPPCSRALTYLHAAFTSSPVVYSLVFNLFVGKLPLSCGANGINNAATAGPAQK